jgi:hypothetical protein
MRLEVPERLLWQVPDAGNGETKSYVTPVLCVLTGATMYEPTPLNSYGIPSDVKFAEDNPGVPM